MKNKHFNILRLTFFVTVIFSFTSSWGVRVADIRYRSYRLEDLARLVGIKEITDTLPPGNYPGIWHWKNLPLDVVVEGREVSHIGVQLFSPETRRYLTPPRIYDFIERYLLEYYVMPKPKLANGRNYKVDNFRADQVKIEAGQFKDFHKILTDTTLDLSMMFEDQRRYTLEWSRNALPVYAISFPASHSLIEGYDYDEAESRLRRNISLPDTCHYPATSLDASEMEKCDSLRGDFFILKGEQCFIPSINSDKYVCFDADSAASLLCDPRYPAESLANLLTTGEIGNYYNVTIHIAQTTYLPNDIKVPLNTMIRYFMKEGCRPYFGLKKYSPENGTISALLLFKNETNGFLHLLDVDFDVSTLYHRHGNIPVRLTPFIPLHDIKNMYKNEYQPYPTY